MKIVLKKPENNLKIEQLTYKQAQFNRNNFEVNNQLDYLNLTKEGEDDTIPAAVEFEWDIMGDKNQTFFIVSENDDFSDKKRIECAEDRISLTNFKLGQKYYWKIAVTMPDGSEEESEVYTFITSEKTPRWISVGGLSNVRDIGGFETETGEKIKQGMVFRGSEMEFHHHITDEGMRVMIDDLKIKTDLDLREEAVGKIDKSALGEDVNWQLIPCKAYNEFLEQKEICKKIFKAFCDEKNYPVYVHCWGGADRTGTVILMLCAILGMSEKDLFLDYEMTSLSIWGGRSIKSDLFQGFLKELDNYGDKDDSINVKCKNYLLSAGITEEDINTIKNILLES